MEFLSQGAILMLSAVDWMSTENALAVIDGWLRGSFQKTLLEPGPATANCLYVVVKGTSAS
jgi:hypothetical protein